MIVYLRKIRVGDFRESLGISIDPNPRSDVRCERVSVSWKGTSPVGVCN